ncbi:MAG: hypothetical protein KIH69_012670 [Anaerolineae bacterium]|nr:hypothetical protein [Anaerolineae bacterium]
MKNIKFITQVSIITILTFIAISLSVNQQVLSKTEAPTIPSATESTDINQMTEFGAFKWCYLWCTTVNAGVNNVAVTVDLTRTQDTNGRAMKGTIHFLLVSASTNMTFSVLRTSPLPGRLVTPTITTITQGTRAIYEFTDIPAGGYEIVTILSETGIPGTSQWGGYAFWNQNFNINQGIPRARDSVCTTTGCTNTQTYIGSRMSVTGVVTGTRNGEAIQGPIHILLMPAERALLMSDNGSTAFNTSPLPGFLFTPTISSIAGGRVFTLNLSNVKAGHWRAVRLITLDGEIGQSNWNGLFNWTENTVYSVQYLANILNNLEITEPEPQANP